MAIYLPIVTQFNPKGLKEAEKGFKDLEGAQAKAKYALGKANKYAAVALGGLVAGLGDAVKGAMEDEQAQKLLARQLQKTTNATDAQIKGMEDYISAQGKLKGVTDDELRPALAGLVRVTKDIDEAQKVANLSMDVAAAKGLSLETVTKAMEKAYGGNMTALAKLSPELRDMIKGGATLEEVMAQMAKTFGGAATDSANTAAGSMKRLGVALGEAKEGVGAALLPILEKALPVLQKFATWAQNNPTLITAVAAAFGVLAASVVVVNAAMALNPVVLITAGIVALGAALVMAYKKFDTFGMVVRTVVNGVAGYFEFLANAYIKMINLVIRGINLIKPGKDIGPLSSVSFGRLGNDDEAVSTSVRAFEESQKMSSVAAGVDATNFESVIAAGISSAKVQPAKPMELKAPTGTGQNTMAGGLAGVGGFNGYGGMTVNVNGGDPNAVVNALRTYMRQNGSIPIKVSDNY
jgi:hypothetical protein